MYIFPFIRTRYIKTITINTHIDLKHLLYLFTLERLEVDLFEGSLQQAQPIIQEVSWSGMLPTRTPRTIQFEVTMEL